MLEVIGAAAVIVAPAVGLFYAVTVGVLMRRGGLENVLPGMAAGALAGLAWAALALWWLT